MTPAPHPNPAAALAGLLLLAGPAGAAEAPAPPEARIEALLAEAHAAESPETAAAALDRAEQLLKEHLGRIDAVMRGLLRGDVLRTRGRLAVVAWKRRPEELDLRRDAQAALLSAVEQYAQAVKLCEERLEALEARLRIADPAGDPQWRELSGRISRANYSEAWSHYNLGLVADDTDRREAHFGRAVERFSSFTARGYRSHPITADCFLGQALCHYELGQFFQAMELLKPIRADNASGDLFKRATYLRIKAAQAYGSSLEGENAARAYFDALPAGRKLDAMELGMAVERARCLAALADPNRNPEYHQLFRGRLDEVAKLLHACGEPWRTELAEVLGEQGGATPFRHLTRARSALEAGKYDQAAAEARRGLLAAGAPGEGQVAADLRYALAAALLSEGRHLEGHRAAAEFLRHHSSDRRAAPLCGPAIQAGRKALHARPPLPAEEFLAFLDAVQAAFGGTDEARRIAWYRAAVLLERGEYRRAERALSPVPPDSPVYLLAQYGLAVAAIKQAETPAPEAGPDANALVASLDRATAAVGRFAGAAKRELSPEEQQAARTVVDVALAGARRYLELPQPRPAEALALLDRADELPDAARREARRRAALRVLAHVRAGDLEAAKAPLAALLTTAGAAGPDALAAFAEVGAPLAEEFERLLASGPAEAAQRLGEQVVGIYGLLLAHVRDASDGEVRRQEGPARHVLAETLRKLGRFAQAAEHYQWLVEHTPRGQAGAAIRGLALCREAAGRYDQAADHWRILARGLQEKTQPWYEARYHWIRCVDRQGRRDEAARLLAYFRLQHPRIDAAAWRERFDALAAELGRPAPPPATRAE